MVVYDILNVAKAIKMQKKIPMWHRITITLLNWLQFQRQCILCKLRRPIWRAEDTYLPQFVPWMASRGKNSGNSEETQPVDGQRERPFCAVAEAESYTLTFTRGQRQKENTYLFRFFGFFSKVCSTKSLPGKLLARRKHPAIRGPAWEISNIAYCKPNTAREAAVKRHRGGESENSLCEQTINTAGTLIIAPRFQQWARFAMLLNRYGMPEELHSSQWRSWGESKLK